MTITKRSLLRIIFVYAVFLSSADPLTAAEGKKTSTDKNSATVQNASGETESDKQLRARLEELRKSLAELGTKIGSRADAETKALKLEIEDELAEIDARLNESRQKLANATTDASESVRADIGKLLKSLSSNIDDLAGKIEKKPENQK